MKKPHSGNQPRLWEIKFPFIVGQKNWEKKRGKGPFWPKTCFHISAMSDLKNLNFPPFFGLRLICISLLRCPENFKSISQRVQEQELFKKGHFLAYFGPKLKNGSYLGPGSIPSKTLLGIIISWDIVSIHKVSSKSASVPILVPLCRLQSQSLKNVPTKITLFLL